MKRMIRSVACIGLSLLLLMQTVGCADKIQAQDLTKSIRREDPAGKAADASFKKAVADFSVNLFQAAVQADDTLADGKNALISPISVMLALTMTANGADGKTREEMEAVLGGEISLEALNEYLYTYAEELPSAKGERMRFANSLWIRENQVEIVQDFLQKSADYYKASIYEAPFDTQTVEDINYWVNKHTDGMIDQLVEKFDRRAAVLLLNALAFDGLWKTPFAKDAVSYEWFYPEKEGKDPQSIKMLSGKEMLYIADEDVTGFLKPYKKGNYSFAALLPREDCSMEEFVSSLTGEKFLKWMQSARETEVEIMLPKFNCEYSTKLKDALISMGMPTAFGDESDFTKMGSADGGALYIDNVIHKTYISVDERGTKAAAATEVEVYLRGPGTAVNLNRPFVYAIIDNATSLPLFIGMVNDLS